MILIGFGTKSDTQMKSIQMALDEGYKLIDTKDSNKSIDCFKNLKYDRDKVKFCSKLMGESSKSNHKAENVRKAFLKDLQRSGLKYWDVYYLHTTFSFDNHPILDTWNEILNLKKDKLIKETGLSNITIEQLQCILLNSEKPDYIQIEIHPYLNEDEIVTFCHENNIKIVAHSPFGSGKLHKEFKNDSILKKITDKYNINVYQLILKWHIKRNIIPIPSSNNLINIKSNLHLDFDIDDSDIKLINSLNKHKRIYVKPNHDEYRFEINKPMDSRKIIETDKFENEILRDIKEQGYHVSNIKNLDNELFEICKFLKIHSKNKSNECTRKLFNNRDFMRYYDDEITNEYKSKIKNNSFLNNLSLTYLKRNYNKKIFLCKNIMSNDLLPHNSGLFHRDVQSQKTLKVMIYLNDVDNFNGPLKIVDEDCENIKWFIEKSHKSVVRTTNKELGKNNIESKIITGESYTVIFFEGSLIHSGGYIQRGIRYCLYLEYF